MTLAFVYLIIFLGGFTLALVTGLGRRILHPSELCDHVVVPSHEHWRSQYTPTADAVISFVTLFGLATLVVHGVSKTAPLVEVLIGLAAGLVGVILLRTWIGRVCDPSVQASQPPGNARVVREIPPKGYGQVEVEVGDTVLRLAARSQDPSVIPAGTLVSVLDRQESVVVVERAD